MEGRITVFIRRDDLILFCVSHWEHLFLSPVDEEIRLHSDTENFIFKPAVFKTIFSFFHKHRNIGHNLFSPVDFELINQSVILFF